MTGIKTAAIARRERALRKLAEERQWMEEHGGSETGYVHRYGSANDAEHYGDGGEAIFAADFAALKRAEEEALDAIREARKA